MPENVDDVVSDAATKLAEAFEEMLEKPTGSSGDTVAKRLRVLKSYRAQKAKDRKEAGLSPEFECKETHPVAFAVLQATKEPLQALLPDKKLHVYTENTGTMKNSPSDRNCGGALVADSENDLAAYDERARIDVIVGLEARRYLNTAGKSDALVAGECDMVTKTGDQPSAVMPVGTSAFTDGVDWYLARIAWRMNDKCEWKREIIMSPTIDVTVEGGWALLARWFAFSFHEAVTKPVEETGITMVKWRVGERVWDLADVFSMGTRSTVTRWRQGADSVVVKFIATSGSADRAIKLAAYVAHERAMLQKLAHVPSIVHAHPTFSRVDSVFTALEDCGDSLARLNIRGAAGRALAKIVLNDIWRGALPALQRANLCHFDITEHNIAIDHSRTSAKLIDLESCTEIGQSTPSSPTAAMDVPDRPAVATAAFDEQAVCAILQCLWLLDVSSFANRKKFFKTFAADETRRQLVSEIK
jgi:hypothetical protein